MGGPLDQTNGQGSPEPKTQPPHDELQAMLKRLDELLAGTLAKRSVPLPQEITTVWSTSFAALQGFVQFVAALCREDIAATKGAALEKSTAVAGELRDAVARMQEARLAGHAALASDTADGQESLSCTAGGANLRALCPRCQELYEWAPSYYANAAPAVSERLSDLRRRCQARAEELRQQVSLERSRLREIVDNELEGIFAARTTSAAEGTEQGASKVEQGSQEGPAHAAAEATTEEPCSAKRLQQPRSTLEMIRQRTSQIRRQRTRRLAGEQFDALRRAKADEVMGAVDDHLVEAWEKSMGSWLEEATAPPLLPKQELNVPAAKEGEDTSLPSGKELNSRCPGNQEEQAAKDWHTKCALDYFEAAPLTPGATPCATPRTPKAILMKGPCWEESKSSATKNDGTPVKTPCRLLDQQRQATPGSIFRIDVMDDVQEAYRATFSGQDVVRDFEQNYEMFNGRPKPVATFMADDV